MGPVLKTTCFEKAASRQDRKDRKIPFGIWPALALVSMILGILSPVLGMIFVICHSAIEGDGIFGEIGTVFMIASIPRLLAGSHFLDAWDKRRKRTEHSFPIDQDPASKQHSKSE